VFDSNFTLAQHLKLNKREIINLYRFGNKDAEGRLAFKAWMEGFRNTTGVHAMRSVPEFLKPKASRCSVHGSPWQWAETPKESLTIHKVGSRSFQEPYGATTHKIPPTVVGEPPEWQDMKSERFDMPHRHVEVMSKVEDA
jgi:hypothetical protein